MFHSSQSTGWADQWADQVPLLGNSQGKLTSKEARIKETRELNPNQYAREELAAGDRSSCHKRRRAVQNWCELLRDVVVALMERNSGLCGHVHFLTTLQYTKSMAVLSMLLPSVLKKPMYPCTYPLPSLGLIGTFIRSKWDHGYGTTFFPTIGDYYYHCECLIFNDPHSTGVLLNTANPTQWTCILFTEFARAGSSPTYRFLGRNLPHQHR